MGKPFKRKPAGVRWGSIRELDRRVKPGSPGFKKLPYRLQQLQSWRGDHAVASHRSVRRYARKYGVKPSSDITLGTKIRFFQDRLPLLQKKQRG